jgi:antitoxin VapB
MTTDRTPIAAEPATAYLLSSEPTRHVRLFRNGANQAVRIPKEFELPGKEATLRREGSRLILEAIPERPPKGTASALLAALHDMENLGALEEDFPDTNQGLLPLDAMHWVDD